MKKKLKQIVEDATISDYELEKMLTVKGARAYLEKTVRTKNESYKGFKNLRHIRAVILVEEGKYTPKEAAEYLRQNYMSYQDITADNVRLWVHRFKKLIK
jgi:hypothetical protein